MIAEALCYTTDIDTKNPIWRDMDFGDLMLTGNLVVQVFGEVYHPLLFADVYLRSCIIINSSVILSVTLTTRYLLLSQRFLLQYVESGFFLKISLDYQFQRLELNSRVFDRRDRL